MRHYIYVIPKRGRWNAAKLCRGIHRKEKTVEYFTVYISQTEFVGMIKHKNVILNGSPSFSGIKRKKNLKAIYNQTTHFPSRGLEPFPLPLFIPFSFNFPSLL